MGIPERDQRILFARSGNRCAFEDCRRELVADAESGAGVVVLGEMAHIIAEHDNGPRGEASIPIADRNRYTNLILLCNIHHQLVDAQPESWTVERLRALKDAHEAWVEQRLPGTVAEPLPRHVTDVLFSTLLTVEHLPPRVFSVAVNVDAEGEIREKLGPEAGGEMSPYIVREGRLLTFTDLKAPLNPFAPVVGDSPVQRHDAFAWWDEPDRSRWYVDLLNRALRQYCARHRLAFDRDHKRFYFAAARDSIRRTARYRPLNRAWAERDVVWQPTRRDTGEPRGYWLHRSATLRFLYSGRGTWALVIRPGLVVTEDGFNPPPSDVIGRRVTRRMNRMFNYELLAEVHFWRDILGAGKPRIVLPFGNPAGVQHLRLATDLASAEVEWPGIPERHRRPFANVEIEEGLFSWGEMNSLELDEGEDRDDYEGLEDTDGSD